MTPFAANLLPADVRANAHRNRVLAASFHTGPTFRMGFDAHVRKWAKTMQAEVWEMYWSDPRFACRYDQLRANLSAVPLPAWKEN